MKTYYQKKIHYLTNKLLCSKWKQRFENNQKSIIMMRIEEDEINKRCYKYKKNIKTY